MLRRFWIQGAALVVLAMLLAPLQAAGQVLPGETTSDGRRLAFSPAGVTLNIEEFAGGFIEPVQVTNAGDGSGRMFVSERPGRVRIVQDGVVLPEPFLDIREIVRDADGEQGFFAVAFHPAFEENGTFFAVYTKEPDGTNVLARLQVSAGDPNRADPASLVEMITLADREPNHNGGDLAFGPDGYLYYATGDEGSRDDKYKNAQNGQSLFGKMLRLDVDSGEPYGIPPDNPFVDDPEMRDEIWAIGLRNPWRYSFDAETGDLYIADVGQDMWEEVNVQPAASTGGENYGWPMMEAFTCNHNIDPNCNQEGLTLPVLSYSHEGEKGVRDGCTVIGGYVYRGSVSSFMDGAYIFGDWCEGRIWAGYQDEAGAWQMTQLLDSFINWTSFGLDEAGEIYGTDQIGGRVFRLVFGMEPHSELTVSEIAPGGALARGETFSLTVRGAGFSEGAEVLWSGQPLPTTFVSAEALVAEVPESALAEPGVAQISVLDPDGGPAPNSVPFLVSTAPFSDPAFEALWSRSDKPVADRQADRTWIWGSSPLMPARLEFYAQSPESRRMVLYFDKSRMEITHPNGDPGSIWYITNGLLVAEMMDGHVQVGDAQYQPGAPADVNVAGDLGDPQGVTYATLAGLRGAAAYPENAVITSVLGSDGAVSDDQSLAEFDVRAGPLSPETGHRTASVFWTFMNSEGTIIEGGATDQGLLFENPYFATGLPITEPYWTTVSVAGTPQDVLLQCFERRCLTFTPGNEPGWQVEAGNVGLHYYTWRYGE